VFERFLGDTRATVKRAVEISEAEGASLVEAEHLLLALVDPVTDAVGQILVAAGADADAIRAARDREFRSSLEAVGITTGRTASSGSGRVRRGRTTRFSQSAKLALERTLERALASGDRRVSNTHLLEGIVTAERGRTPRLLEELGTTSGELRDALRAA
jgi:ATP-dependent Clp protease ATP-binding subunit ClpA